MRLQNQYALKNNRWDHRKSCSDKGRTDRGRERPRKNQSSVTK